MAKSSPIIASLNAGEQSPYLGGRVDFDQYPKGLRICENFIPLVQGPLTKAPGTRHVAEVKDSSKKVRLEKFVFSDDDAYVLELGHEYVRFYTNHGQLLSGGVPYEIASPYDEEDLSLLRFAQSADVVYIAHPLYAPRKLSRYSATNWTLTAVEFENGPIDIENTTSTAIQASATTGTVTLTASADVFSSGQIGSFIKLNHESNGDVPPWEAGASVSIGNVRSYDGNFYIATTNGTTGGDPPIHLKDVETDGATGVKWEYIHSGFGIAKISAVASATSATAIVTSRLPDATVTAATTYWALGAWSADKGYPGAVTFYGDRLYWGGSIEAPQSGWGSVVGAYEDHKPGTEDDSALAFTISATDVNQIRWMDGDEKGLLIGTTRGEWIVRPSANNEALTPFNIHATRITNYGSNFVSPSRVHKAIMFIQSAAKKLREMAYTLDVDGFTAPDMTVRAEHISGGGFLSLAYQAQPSPVIWAPRADGQLPGMTYEREQDVLAWFRRVLGGTDVYVESVAVIPTPDGFADEVWLAVRRTVNGATVRYIEYMEQLFGHDAAQEDAFFVDSGATYEGAPATTISGLDFLEGETVKILTDGATHPEQVVSGGQITLNSSGSKVHVGLGYRAVAQTQRLEAGADQGTAQGKKGRISKVLLRLYRTGALLVGRDPDEVEAIPLRSSEDEMDSAPALISEDVDAPWFGGWEKDCSVTIVSEDPTPATILAIMPEIERTRA